MTGIVKHFDDFDDVVNKDDLLALLFSFHGSVSRLVFWAHQFGIFLVQTAVFSMIPGEAHLLIWPILILSVWTNIAIYVKRYHHRNKSGWWLLLGLIPFVGPLIVVFECGLLPGDNNNRFVPPPKAEENQPIVEEVSAS